MDSRLDQNWPGGLRDSLLEDRLGLRLPEAVILYAGHYAYRHEDWAWILPLSQLLADP